jgi:membrane associated rhomboid family serine protease
MKKQQLQYFRKKRKSRNNQDDDDDYDTTSQNYRTLSDGGSSAGTRVRSANGDDLEDEEEDEIYIVRQQYGYCSIFFSAVQTVVLALMMWRCGVAPLALNPMVGPYPDALSEWGGKNSVLILEDGETYRLLTPIFLHAGVVHLVGNVAVQLETGLFFEREWGSIRWLTVYLVSAVGSTILSVIAMPNAVSVGSSGAVMGLFGGKLAEVVLRFFERRRTRQDEVAHQVRKEQCCVVTASVVLVMLFSFIPFVDWAAHLGGLAAGFLCGIAVFSLDIEHCAWKIFWLVVGIAVTVSTFVAALTYMYSGNIETIDELRDVCGYYKENYQDYQCNCMRAEYVSNGGGNNGQNRWMQL